MTVTAIRESVGAGYLDGSGQPGPEPETDVASVSVVIPVRNEERNIEWVLGRLPSYVDEVVIVDGFSSDRTIAKARLARPDVVVVQQRGSGKGSAMRTGFETATCDFIVVLDADCSMDPIEIDYYVDALAQGYEFVKGSRFLRGGGSLDLTSVRKWGNSVLTRSVNVLWGVPFSDLCYGYVAFRNDVLPELCPTATGFEIETEMCVHAVKANLRIAEVPTIELPRMHGNSNLNAWRDGKRILSLLVRERMSVEPIVVDALDRRGIGESHGRPALSHSSSATA
ncbi:MAG TPA: glycosyltransferase family 2 protein [Actinomycetes bacterium]|nr:glycosyltransferase family 2 protein [Actinomycetes bacterium]